MNKSLNNVIKKLSKTKLKKQIKRDKTHPLPNIKEIEEIIELLRIVLFPSYFGDSETLEETHYVGSVLDLALRKLKKEILRGHCFVCEKGLCKTCKYKKDESAKKFLAKIPEIREKLNQDVISAYEKDPASNTPGEVVFCYPGVRAIMNQRIAHELYSLGVPIIPRIITELAHSETGIDIHPGAKIGERFFIDHGTGIVIGETCVIGKNVSIYQGVTLGAKSFPLDKNGNPIKGIARHPIVKDNVIIYSGATILGRITIGKNSMIGGNVWLTRDVKPNSKITIKF